MLYASDHTSPLRIADWPRPSHRCLRRTQEDLLRQMARALHHGLLPSATATAAAAASPTVDARRTAPSRDGTTGAAASGLEEDHGSRAAAPSFRSRYDEAETRLASLLVDAPDLRLSLRALPQVMRRRNEVIMKYSPATPT